MIEALAAANMPVYGVEVANDYAPVQAHSESVKASTQQVKELTLNNEDFKKVVDIHLNWYFFSLKAVMAQMAKELLQNADNGKEAILSVMESKSAPSLIQAASKGLVRRLSHLIVSLFGKQPRNDPRRMWSTTYNKMLELADVLEENEKMPGARVYSMRVYDLVMNKVESAQKPAQVHNYTSCRRKRNPQ
ncbi:unnamed protein product [Angiostrongylus costaricensis]|uniref:DUF3987 domain-containing protein n=1 Tax=Angiostrongylus costaricensis TaxID=334426 RepID=A0A0R3Q189_ANGCS|nr:unnamed protein product [Angiostrongylus costaricensis]